MIAHSFTSISRVRLWGVLQTGLLVAFLGASGANAARAEVWPKGYESYAKRPDFTTVVPKSHPELGQNWNRLVRAHMEAVALLFEVYPDREIYFLARDSEYLHDLAKELSRDDPSLHARLHLLNISRTNKEADHIREYLAQEGLSDRDFQNGKKVLFVDTGFSGSIPKAIQSYVSSAPAEAFRTHLICSVSKLHPSMRVFLTALDPTVAAINPEGLTHSVLSYENLAKYTGRSDRFGQSEDGRWEALSPVDGGLDGVVSPKTAQIHREDLLHEARQSEFKTLFRARRRQWKNLRSVALAAAAPEEVASAFKKLLSVSSSDPFVESLVRDFHEMLRKNAIPSAVEAPDLQEVGLSTRPPLRVANNKHTLITQKPEWAQILKNPEVEIEKSIQRGEAKLLSAIAKEIQDDEFIRILCEVLGVYADEPAAGSLIRLLIDQHDSSILRHLAVSTFSNPSARNRTELLLHLIENASEGTVDAISIHVLSTTHFQKLEELIQATLLKASSLNLQHLATSVFSQPHAAKMGALALFFLEKSDASRRAFFIEEAMSKGHLENQEELIRWVLRKGDSPGLISLASSVFSQPASASYQDLLRILIDQANSEVLTVLARSTFTQAHTVNMEDLLQRALEKADQATLKTFAQTAFAKPHARYWARSIQRVIERGDSGVLLALAISTFSQPHTAEMEELLQLLISKADASVRLSLASFTFSQPHTEKMGHLLRTIVESADQATLFNLATFVFSKPHTKSRSDLLKLIIEKGDTATLGALAEATFPQPHTAEMGDQVKQLIQKADQSVLLTLVQKSFSQPHARSWDRLLPLLIERAEGQVLQELALSVFAQSPGGRAHSLRLLIEKVDGVVTLNLLENKVLSLAHWNAPEHQVLRDALRIPNRKERVAFLAAHAEGMSPLRVGPIDPAGCGELLGPAY